MMATARIWALVLVWVLYAGAAHAQPNAEKSMWEKTQQLVQTTSAVESLLAAGRYREAVPLAEQVLALQEQLWGRDSLLIVGALANLGWTHLQLEEYVRAEALYGRALTLAERSLGTESSVVATIAGNLGAVYRGKGEYVKAEGFYGRALAQREKTLGARHPEVALLLHGLAGLYRLQGLHAKALPLCERALAIVEATAGVDELEVNVLQNLGALRAALGESDKAEALYLRAAKESERLVGAAHPSFAHILHELGQLYVEKGAYDQAEATLRRALAIREASFGRAHPQVSQSLSSLADLYQARGELDQAEPLLQRALQNDERAYGSSSPALVPALANLAALHRAKGRYQQAEPLLLRAQKLVEAAAGQPPAGQAIVLVGLADNYREQGEYAKAEPLLQRALALQTQALAAGHPDLAITCNSLGVFYLARGDALQAEEMFTRALAITEKAWGPTHPHTTGILGNLGAVQGALGQYDQAQRTLARALALTEAGGDSQLGVATQANNLAQLYRLRGDSDQAEKLLQRALRIQEARLGPEHPDVTKTLGNLAAVSLARGAHGPALALLEKVLALREKRLGGAHPDVAMGLNNLAFAHVSIGEYGEAEQHLARALSILEKAVGRRHPSMATLLGNLGDAYRRQGAYATAEPLLRSAVETWEALGSPAADTARALATLAALHQAMGASDQAEPLLRRALELHARALGAGHPDQAALLSNLAMICVARGRLQEAVALIGRALGIGERHRQDHGPLLFASLANAAVIDSLRGQSARAERGYQRALQLGEQVLGADHPDLATVAGNLAGLQAGRGKRAQAEGLYARALDLRETQLRRELARLSESRQRALMSLVRDETDEVVSFHAHSAPESRRALELALTSVLRRKGRVLDSIAGGGGGLRERLPPPLRASYEELEAARAQLSALLYGRDGGNRSRTQRTAAAALRARIEVLEQALSEASSEVRAATEPVTIAAVQASLPPGAALIELVRYRRREAAQRGWREARYLAYILKSKGPPRWVALGAAEPIDRGIDEVSRAMHQDPDAEKARSALQRLAARVMAPLRGELEGVGQLIIAPDSKLNLVPFEALVDSKGAYLLEQHLVSYVGAGRDLLRAHDQMSPRTTATLVAAPDYGAGATFEPLPEVELEAREIQRYLRDPVVLVRAAANKRALAALKGPTLLHVSTHGFYAWSRGGAAASGAAERAGGWDASGDTGMHQRGMAVVSLGSLGSLGSGGAEPAGEPLEAETEALDRAGLALSDANRGGEGIVTAREISGLDWRGTQLVALSACETGVGLTSAGEGVFGLRRALVMAGAETQVVSLWRVSDAATRLLMTKLYEGLALGLGRAEALRRAKRALVRLPAFSHPYYWASFIAAGDWRPLRGGTLQPAAAPAAAPAAERASSGAR